MSQFIPQLLCSHRFALLLIKPAYKLVTIWLSFLSIAVCKSSLPFCQSSCHHYPSGYLSSFISAVISFSNIFPVPCSWFRGSITEPALVMSELLILLMPSKGLMGWSDVHALLCALFCHLIYFSALSEMFASLQTPALLCWAVALADFVFLSLYHNCRVATG